MWNGYSLYTRYPIVARRAWPGRHRPSASRELKGILHTRLHVIFDKTEQKSKLMKFVIYKYNSSRAVLSFLCFVRKIPISIHIVCKIPLLAHATIRYLVYNAWFGFYYFARPQIITWFEFYSHNPSHNSTPNEKFFLLNYILKSFDVTRSKQFFACNYSGKHFDLLHLTRCLHTLFAFAR